MKNIFLSLTIVNYRCLFPAIVN